MLNQVTLNHHAAPMTSYTTPSLNERPLAADTMLVSILNWNGMEDTIACLTGIDRQVSPRVQFAVLDNGSQIDPTDDLHRLFPDVEVFREPHNLGFCGGHNRMIQLAIERGYGSVLILNNDCEIDIHAIVELQKTMDADPQAAVVSSLIYRSGPNRIALMVAGSIDWAQHRSIRPSSPDAATPMGHPTLLVGTALLLRCTAMKRIGLLDERYFAYYDDNDLSARIAAAGLKAVYCKTSICLHRYKPLHEHSAMALYLMSRNQWLFWQTHTPSEHRNGMTRRLLAQSLHTLALLKKNDSPPDKTNAIV
ncbi:MAG: glycosyltransferase family 2 protein, partial [Rhodoferax sp.]